MDEIRKIWAFLGVLRLGVGTPRSSEGPRHGVACPRLGVANRRIWLDSGTPRCSIVHNVANFGVLFCFAFPLLQGLVYWTNKDPISV